jgi:signal transduction histidine kinase/CheY-like chemotaxis protein
VPILSRGYILRDAQGAAIRVSGTNTDLTERLRLDAAQRGQVAAEAANAAKTEFLSRMSHELCTPLNAVLGFSQLLMADQRQPLSSSQQRHLAQIEQSGWHLLKLVDDILDLSHIDAGRVTLQLHDVDVAALLHECGGMVASAAAARQIGVEIRCDSAVTGVRADRTRIRQILLNLLSNAVKYTQPGGAVVLDAARGHGGRVLLRVRDNGPGLTAQQMAKLFQPFNRLGQELGGAQGTGIGLVISQRLAALMGGDIQVDSTPGVGTLFTLSMAEGAPPPQRRPPPPPAAAIADPPRAPSRSVLYIEDNAVNVEVMRAMFEFRPFFDLEVQTGGMDGLDAARRRKPDLILLDMQLPDIDGIEFLARLRREAGLADVPVVAVSASAMPAQIAAANAAGVADYLTKPVLLVELLATLDRYLAGAAANPL